MKTLAPTLTISIAFYGMLLLILSSISYGFDVMANDHLNTDATPKEIVIEFEEEAYIDDIPFDTKAIAEAYLETAN